MKLTYKQLELELDNTKSELNKNETKLDIQEKDV